MSILLKDNFYKNWHRAAYHGKAKKKELSQLYPVSVHKTSNGCAEISFQEPFGEQVTFFLTKETIEHLINSLK